jgi:hypothetical protein
MTIGLTLPFVTEADPDRAGEGSLDPLGLARIADRLADELAPGVTARMSRIRFLTAIAACSNVFSEPADFVGPDGTPAYLAFEWHLVEALVRSPPQSGTDAVPGIQKARARLREPRRHLDSGSYLEGPKVFGFHGVYKRLGRDLGIIDDRLILLRRGDELLDVWEREQGASGFALKRRGSPGGKLAVQIDSEVRRTLEQGAVQLGPGSGLWKVLSASFAPRAAGSRERRQLWAWLTDERHPVRDELARLMAADADAQTTERKLAEQLLASNVSPALRIRLRAVAAFEAAVRPLDDAFRLIRSVASQHTPSPVSALKFGAHPKLQELAHDLPRALIAASTSLEKVGLAGDFETALGHLTEERPADQMVEAIMERHRAVQTDKGKRAWFEQEDRGYVVRGIGRLDEPFAESSEFLHPYRLYALRSFARDLRPNLS